MAPRAIDIWRGDRRRQNTVSGVDQTLGGTLGEAGVTKVTEEVVNGVAGPESTVGEIVDKVGETVSGLLGGKR